MSKIYFYSDSIINNFIKDAFSDFVPISPNKVAERNFNLQNQNIVFLFTDPKNFDFWEPIFIKNNCMVFLKNKPPDFDESKFHTVNFYFGLIHINKIINHASDFFINKCAYFGDIQILDEKIINLQKNLSCSITPLEKKILLVFVDQKKIKRDYFLEKAFGLKKNIETKTIESHLTRIRKKLLTIKSNIQISSKDDIFFIKI
tara:strand:- start:6070 stop:6675 length:606 start_codon:yes stop_codon:yes gene_type:complete